MKESAFDTPKPLVKHYQVVHNGMIVFVSPVYALCNSYIFTHAIQGVRPKPVYV